MGKQRRRRSVEAGVAAAARKEYATAVEIWRSLAEKGDLWAQFYLAAAYSKGEGVPRDHRVAIRWYRLAANQGHALAMYDLGSYYYDGDSDGVPRSFVTAIRWFRRAAKQGYGPAQVMLAMMYEDGEGAPQDYAQAARWYGEAAGQGMGWGFVGLGRLYQSGMGFPSDEIRAHLCFSLAVANAEEQVVRKQATDLRDEVAARMTPAQLSLAYFSFGQALEKGDGVPADPVQASKWYRKAANRGYAPAQTVLGHCYQTGTGVVQDLGQAAKWFHKAAGQGFAPAHQFLACMYFSGEGLPQDDVQAHMWASLAVANAADAQARKTAVGLRRAIAAEMTPAQVAKAQRLAQAWQPEGNARIAREIRKLGWFCLTVVPDDSSTETFAYTIGFTETFDAPEIAVFGLPGEKAYPLLAECGKLLRQGKRFRPGVKCANVLAGDYKVIFKPVKEECLGEYFGGAARYYGARLFSAMVMFLPDKKHLFPWQKRYQGSMQKEALGIV